MKKLVIIALAFMCLCLTGSMPLVDTSDYYEDLDPSRVETLIDSFLHKKKPPTVQYPDYDFFSDEILIPIPIDSLKIAVDSVMHELDKKITTDSYYYYLKLFNDDEYTALEIIQENRGICIENFFGYNIYNRRRRMLNDLSDYYKLRDWYYENKENIDWLKVVEKLKEIANH